MGRRITAWKRPIKRPYPYHKIYENILHIHYLSSSELISDTANSVHVMKMCQAFINIGHKVTLYGKSGHGDLEDIYAYYGVRDPFPIHRYDEKEKGISALLWYLRLKMPFLKVAGFPSYVFALQYLKPLISNNLTDNSIVYGRNLYWLSALPKNVSFIAESHRPPANKLEFIMERKLFNRKNCKRIVVISEKLKEIYLSLFPELETKILVAHDAADDPFADNKFNLKINNKIKKVGYVGHLYAGRGIDIIIASAAVLNELEFHIIGGKPEAIEKIKEAPHLPKNLFFHGHKPHSELKKYYQDFDVVLAPYQRKVAVGGNRGDTSAFMSPLKIFEYMSYGKPLICSDIPVLREVLKDGENSLLVQPDDSAQWVRAIQKISSDKELQINLSERARQDFETMYSWNIRAKNILTGLNVDL